MYFNTLAKLLEENQVLAMELIFGELLQGVKNNREKSIINEYWLNLPKFSEKNIFIKAGIESRANRWLDKGIGLIDSAIIIMAKETQSTIWTLDKKLLKALPKNSIFKL